MKIGFPNIHIHGLLSDMGKFEFYSYDPVTKKFFLDELIDVNSIKESQISDMIPGLPSILRALLRTDVYFF